MIAPGAVVDEKYWVERVLGRGGMGVVVAATHLTLGQRVALKFLRPEAARDGELVERFLREARAAVRLRGEHVGKVVDVGTAADGLPYIVMEYLEGHDLASALGRSGPLPVATAVDYVLQACAGLVEAHAAGLVHRDLKPANLFLTRRPDGTPLVKVMDFGIAKAMGPIDAAITGSAAVMGSPGYMSPEQLRSARDVDRRADLWSLGIVLYELVCGRRPFAAQTITELAVMLATEPVPALTVPTPRGFASVVARCLEKDPARRYQSVAELAAALALFGSPGAAAVAASIGRVQSGPPPAAVAAGVEALMGATTLTRATSVRVPAGARVVGGESIVRRHRRSLAVVAGAIVVAAAAVAIVITGGGAGGSGRAAVDAGAVTSPGGGGDPVVAPLVLPLDAGLDGSAAVDVAAGAVDSPPPSSGTGARGGRGSGGRRVGGAGEAGPVTMPTADPTAGRPSGAGSATPPTVATGGGSAAPTSGSAAPTSGSAAPSGGGAASSGSAAPSGSGSATPAKGSGAAGHGTGVPDDNDGDGIPDRR
ncbi:MAG: serine/threonine protein kinase [Myxococcales bacterium]|nr:serine/threonine protein kinase [Myxococcales bacterium]MBK7193617.1 serine/threonine protein kinase [Myxococcales bacterium]MBP6844547.1 serine/threonine protein kinase [Kofleriaceae bacterium]